MHLTGNPLLINYNSSITLLPSLQSKWIGGYVEDGHEVRGFESLKQILAPHFELIEEQNMPFLIRETVRKNQWTVAHATVWKRTSV